MTRPILHNFFGSSTSIRVRVALNLKGVSYEYAARNLRTGEQRAEDYLALNPQGLVPALQLAEGTVLTQSLAIIEYLDETHPEPPLLPADALGRARVRGLAYLIACDIHPLNNVRVLNRLRDGFGADDPAIAAWFHHWVGLGFDTLETRLSQEKETGRFCHGDAPGLADICLYAQILNGRRFDLDPALWPKIERIFKECASLPAFEAAAPERQPDVQ